MRCQEGKCTTEMAKYEKKESKMTYYYSGDEKG